MASTIRILPLRGVWQTLGVEQFRGVVPEGIEASANEWGPSTLSFTLAAQKGIDRPDLLPFTPIEYEEDGLLVWSGFVWTRPSADSAYTVNCRGWQYHLEDAVLERVWVHTRLSEHTDVRQHPSAQLGDAEYNQAGNVSADDRGIVFGWANGTVITQNARVGVLLDLGPDSTAKRVVVSWESSNNDGTNTQLYCRGQSSGPFGSSDGAVSEDFFSINNNAGGSGTSSGTVTTARRYVVLFMYRSAAGGTYANDVWFRITSCRIFRDTAYESGNVSILKADQVISDALKASTQLNLSTSLISAGSFSIPEYRTNGDETLRAIMEAVNGYEGKQLRIGGGDLRTLEYRAKPSEPLFEVGEWSGVSFSDASVSGEDIYDQVLVKGQGADGTFIKVLRTQQTMLDRVGYQSGFHRTKVLEARRGIGTSEANQLGDLFLAEHRTAPFAGELRGKGTFIRTLQGGSVPPQVMLRHTGEKIRLSNRLDPDTGAQGRDGRIAGVTFRPDDKSLSIAIDDRRDDFQVLLNRMLDTPA